MFYPTSSFAVSRRCSLLVAGLLSLAPWANAASEQLKGQPSAFVQSYAAGPVDWLPWGDAAFARAKTEGKPVLLVIGSFTSELSRAMHRQTFSNQETAAFLNSNFVCILVDAKERRDVAALYSQYLQDVKQLTGLPMNLFLTPELKPFDGANYLPPTEEWGKEGFSTVAKRAAAAWKADPAAQRAKAEEAVATVTAAQPSELSNAVPASELKQVLTDATEAWRARFDGTNGGFGEPPKYPEPELLRFLLRDPAAKDMALTTLRAIAAGALHDPLDGGFFRYAVDAEWHHPYFQKTLSDQARLALAFLDAAKMTGDASFGEAARTALNYALTQLRSGQGDFSSAEDATLEAATNAHLWTMAEIQEVLGEPAAKSFAAAYSVTASGNIPADAFPGVTTAGKNILYRATGASPANEEKSLADSAAKLLAKRLQRSAPSRDDAATAGMHGLLLDALSTAGAQLKEPRFSSAAKEEVAFITTKLVNPDGTLKRFADRAIPAAPEDYAFVIKGLTAYSDGVSDQKTGQLAAALLQRLNTDFWNAKAGRYFVTTSSASPGQWARVVTPTTGQADLPTIESAMLTTLTSKAHADASTTELVTALRGNVSADVRDAAEAARGDLLLSLRADMP